VGLTPADRLPEGWEPVLDLPAGGLPGDGALEEAGRGPAAAGLGVELRTRHFQLQERFLHPRTFPPNPVHVLATAGEFVGPQGILVVDRGQAWLWAARFADALFPGPRLLSSPGAPPGWSLGAALGIHLGLPERRIVALMGDAAFLASCTELETLRRLGARIVVLVLRDGRMGWLGRLQERHYGSEAFVAFRVPNLIRLAKAMGATGLRLERGDNLAALLEEAFQAQVPCVVDVPVDMRGTAEIVEAWGDPLGPL
jgi:acetolactate synthase-1/2/3 large subunit